MNSQTSVGRKIAGYVRSSLVYLFSVLAVLSMWWPLFAFVWVKWIRADLQSFGFSLIYGPGIFLGVGAGIFVNKKISSLSLLWTIPVLLILIALSVILVFVSGEITFQMFRELSSRTPTHP